MPFRVSGKNIEIGEALRERIECAHRRKRRQIFRRRLFGPRDGRQGGLRVSHRMRMHLDSGIMLEAEAMAARCLCQRRSGGAAHREAVAALQTPPQGSAQPSAPRRGRDRRPELCD